MGKLERAKDAWFIKKIKIKIKIKIKLDKA
jgi:hypothetical protein